jgi:glutamate dehydrogenase
VLRYAEGVTDVQGLLSPLLPPGLERAVASRAEVFVKGGASAIIARRIAELQALSFATDIVSVAGRADAPISVATGAFFGVLELFGLPAVIEAAGRLALSDRFDRMALDRALANLLRAQRDLTVDVLETGKGDVGARLAAWQQLHAETVERVKSAVADLTAGDLTVSRLAVAAGLLADLARAA